MPAVVARHEMRVAPVGARALQESDALLLTAIGLQHMRERMHRPGVGGIERDRLAADRLGAPEIARLLEPEGVQAEHETRRADCPCPMRACTRATESRIAWDWPRKK